MAEVARRGSATSTVGSIVRAIAVFRGRRVILDAELAALYGVPTKAFNQAVKRNAKRFPPDFMFQLNRTEVRKWNRSHSVTGSQKHRDPAFRPYAFTEHGSIMAATILNSPRAIEMSVYVVRAFVQLRGLLVSNSALTSRLDELERKCRSHDETLVAIVATIRRLTARPPPTRRGIGFTADL